jgi:hypothetical protein
MNRREIAFHRLAVERLIGSPFERLEDAVSWLTAVQSQDYIGAKWALGLRTRGATEAAIDAAFDAGTIVRTHVMRPTWHFVSRSDVRWLLALTAPRVRAVSAYYRKKLGLDPATIGKSHDALARALEGGPAIRKALAVALERAGVDAVGLRLGYLLMEAELDAVIVSGPRIGKQLSYARFDDRVPPSPKRDRDDALSELALRYFRSHGPATANDFAWWSGLTVGDAKRGADASSAALERFVADDRTYWFGPLERRPRLAKPIVHLLPNYDEFLVAYKDRSASVELPRETALGPLANVLASHIAVRDGQVIGGWQRRFSKGTIAIETKLVIRLDPPSRAALELAAARCGRFFGLEARLTRAPG